MIGMPPPTAASISTYTPRAAAAAAISSPWRAITALFAVTTGLPAAMARRIRERAGSSPPITSTTISTAGSSTTAAGSVHESLGRQVHRPGAPQIPHGHPAQGQLGHQRVASLGAGEDGGHAGSHRAQTEQADADGHGLGPHKRRS